MVADEAWARPYRPGSPNGIQPTPYGRDANEEVGESMTAMTFKSPPPEAFNQLKEARAEQDAAYQDWLAYTTENAKKMSGRTVVKGDHAAPHPTGYSILSCREAAQRAKNVRNEVPELRGNERHPHEPPWATHVDFQPGPPVGARKRGGRNGNIEDHQSYWTGKPEMNISGQEMQAQVFERSQLRTPVQDVHVRMRNPKNVRTVGSIAAGQDALARRQSEIFDRRSAAALSSAPSQAAELPSPAVLSTSRSITSFRSSTRMNPRESRSERFRHHDADGSLTERASVTDCDSATEYSSAILSARRERIGAGSSVRALSEDASRLSHHGRNVRSASALPRNHWRPDSDCSWRCPSSARSFSACSQQERRGNGSVRAGSVAESVTSQSVAGSVASSRASSVELDTPRSARSVSSVRSMSSVGTGWQSLRTPCVVDTQRARPGEALQPVERKKVERSRADDASATDAYAHHGRGARASASTSATPRPSNVDGSDYPTTAASASTSAVSGESAGADSVPSCGPSLASRAKTPWSITRSDFQDPTAVQEREKLHPKRRQLKACSRGVHELSTLWAPPAAGAPFGVSSNRAHFKPVSHARAREQVAAGASRAASNYRVVPTGSIGAPSVGLAPAPPKTAQAVTTPIRAERLESRTTMRHSFQAPSKEELLASCKNLGRRPWKQSNDLP